MTIYAIVSGVPYFNYGGQVFTQGEVANIIAWDGTTPYTPPPGTVAVAIPNGMTVPIGATYANGTFTLPTPPTAPAPTLAQQAQALLNAGLAITSTGTPALNGTYATDAAAVQNATNIAGYISINQKFPGNTTTTLTYTDAAGNPHVFPSTAEFLAFYTAAGNFVADCQDVIYGLSTALPSAAATIL